VTSGKTFVIEVAEIVSFLSSVAEMSEWKKNFSLLKKIKLFNNNLQNLNNQQKFTTSWRHYVNKNISKHRSSKNSWRSFWTKQLERCFNITKWIVLNIKYLNQSLVGCIARLLLADSRSRAPLQTGTRADRSVALQPAPCSTDIC